MYAHNNQCVIVSSAQSRNLEGLQHGDHSSHAISDHYDTIEEFVIADESVTESIFLPQRTDLLPTPGYCGLKSMAQILPPSIYRKMNSNELVEEEGESGMILSVLTNNPFREETAAYFDKDVLQSEDHATIPNTVGSDIHLTPTCIDDIDDRPGVVDPSYLELSE